MNTKSTGTISLGPAAPYSAFGPGPAAGAPLDSLLCSPKTLRFAPSPTGFFHLGSARCALHNSLAAQACGGKMLLRIDDTDSLRNDPAYTDLILASLRRLGVSHPDPVFQSDRSALHQSALDALLASGYARIDCGMALLSDKAAGLLPGAFFDACTGNNRISATVSAQIPKTLLMRSDGTFAYNLCSVADDIDMGVDLVIRGNDHLPNAPKQLAIALALALCGWNRAADFVQNCAFAHVGLITVDGKKMSKRDPQSNFSSLLDSAAPNALRHFALQLGWSHPDPVFDKIHPTIAPADMPALFRQGRLRPSNCAFSPSRLAQLGRAYSKFPG